MSRRILLLSICCLLLTDGSHSLLLPPTIQHHQYNNYRRSITCLSSSKENEELLPPRRVKIRARPTATSKLKGGNTKQQMSSVISKPRKQKSTKSTAASTTAAKSTTVKSISKSIGGAVSKSKSINSNTKNSFPQKDEKSKSKDNNNIEQKWYKPTIHTKSGQAFQHQEMLDHTILSFTEEIQYGRQIVKARQIKDKILTIIEEREERRELNELEMLVDDDSSSDNVDRELGVGLDGEGVNNEEDGLDMEFLSYELEYLSVYGFRPNKDSIAASASTPNDTKEESNSIAGLDLEDDLLINHAQHRSQHLNQLTSDTNYFTPPPKSNTNNNNKGMGHKRTGYRNSSTSSIAQRNSYTSLLHLPLQELTNYDITHTLQISGGRQELIDILLDGAYAREVLMRRNVKLVMSISKNWMRNSFSTASSNLSGAGASAGGGAGGNSGGGSNKKSSDKSTKKYLSQMYEGSWDRPSLDEAVQEGMLGLARAVDKYDPERGLRFSTYATHWITSYVRICFQRAVTGCLRVPSQLHDIKNKYNKIVKDHIQIGEEVPEQEYIAEQLGISEQRLRTAIRATGSLVSVDAPIGSGNGGSYKGSMAGGDGSNSQELLILDTLKW